MIRLFLGLLVSLIALDPARVTTAPSPAPAAPVATIAFDEGEPASVTWDAASRTLFIADNRHNQLWTWTDAGGLKKLATLPDPLGAEAAHATNVGQIVRLADGTLVVARFGKPGGGFSGIVWVNPAAGTSGAVPNLDPARKRVGLAATADGRLFGSYFGMAGGGAPARGESSGGGKSSTSGNGSGGSGGNGTSGAGTAAGGAGSAGAGSAGASGGSAGAAGTAAGGANAARAGGGGGMSGAVTRVDLKTGETDYAPGFKKIVGVLAVGDTLYVSDQMADTIYALPLTGPVPAAGAYKVFATLPRPDQLAAGPDGSLFTGQFQAAPGSTQSLSVRQILRDGTIRIVAQDPDVTRPSGVAYDPDGRRLFVANSGNPAQRFVRIFSIP